MGEKTTSMKKMLMMLLVLASAEQVYSKKKEFTLNAASIEKQMKPIPARSFAMGRSEGIDQQKQVIVGVGACYMQDAEVTNLQYLYYLHDLLRKKDTVAYFKALPDTLVWRDKYSYSEPYVDYYFRHPAYSNYPVVGVSYVQAQMFCDWVTKLYNSDPKRKFSGAVFSLPTEAEWMNAAMGGMDNSPFPWGGPYLRNSKGEYLANFMFINEAEIVPDSCDGQKIYRYYPYSQDGVAGYLNDFADVTAPVRSYWPNKFGMYNMAGNVEEFVAEEGVVKGGSWRDVGYFLQIMVKQTYDPKSSASSERGFRMKMTVSTVEKK